MTSALHPDLLSACLPTRLVVALAFCFPLCAFAQMGVTENSLEWLVASADVIVRASISDISSEPPEDEREWKSITLDVHEVLKGKPEKPIQFAELFAGKDPRFEAWKNAKSEQLWFLVRNEKHFEPGKANRIEHRYPFKTLEDGLYRSVIRLTESAEKENGRLPPPIFDMNLEGLRDPLKILEVVRKEGLRPALSIAAKSHTIRIPHVVMKRVRPSGDINQLVVPVDSRLEVLARRLIESPQDILSPRKNSQAQGDPQIPNDPDTARGMQYSRTALQSEGIKALGYFQSEQNITLLRSLLNHDAAMNYQRPDGTEYAEYYIRKAAYETLKQWGVKIESPKLSPREM